LPWNQSSRTGVTISLVDTGADQLLFRGSTVSESPATDRPANLADGKGAAGGGGGEGPSESDGRSGNDDGEGDSGGDDDDDDGDDDDDDDNDDN